MLCQDPWQALDDIWTREDAWALDDAWALNDVLSEFRLNIDANFDNPRYMVL